MTGTAKKITTRAKILAANERQSCSSRPTALRTFARRLAPAVPVAGIVFDLVEGGIHLAELLANTLHEGAHVRAVTLDAVARDETRSVHEIVEIAVTHVLAGARGEECHHLEFGDRERHLLAFPEYPARLAPELELPAMEEARGRTCLAAKRVLTPLAPGEDQVHSLQEDGEAARFLDKIDRTALQRRLFVDLVVEHGEEDHRSLETRLANAAQDLDAVHPRHLPVEQHDIVAFAREEMLEGTFAGAEVAHVEAGIAQVLAERFPEQLVVVHQDHAGARGGRLFGVSHGGRGARRQGKRRRQARWAAWASARMSARGKFDSPDPCRRRH